ncbi:hypothetical protein ACFFQW_04735 [Umezawaea endophytica]|uniref:DUF3800 domain-containing protein n=1 Tax=Umezawaea endophytica TaxID=1654476 RepID=A0A9X3AEU9_9PSEU|nr:hypothetical protein [Umezawaea endophytica]MCS7476325.1 hypothetical protein [Umezawaea endophytica]
MHMFVDESERGSYLLAATLLPPHSLHLTRTAMREMLPAGCRRLHFKTERDSSRRLIASKLVRSGHPAYVYQGRGPSELVRAILLERLVTDAIDNGVTRLVLDSRDATANSRDRQTIGVHTKAHAAGLIYEHIESWTEPALWISDAVAWCHGAGGDWKRRISPMVAAVTDIGTAKSAKPRQRPSGRAPGLTSSP